MTEAECLALIVDQLGADSDEVRVLRRIAERLAMGKRQYGRLALASDKRDFVSETSEELLDAVAYLAMASVREGT